MTEIAQKIRDAISDMESKVGRDSKHIYVLNDTGVKIQGVSSVSSIIPKDWLSAWGAKEAVKALGYSDYKGDTAYASEILNKIKACESVDNYIEILKEAKGASGRKSKKSMVDGTSGHKWIENSILTCINDSMPIPELPQGMLERPITQFLEWEDKNVDYWIANEALVVYPEKMYAGQLDGIYMSKTGRLCLVDFKFASHISEDYYLQTAGYAACFEPYDIKFDDRIIIRLPKTLEQDEWNPKTFEYKKVPNNIEVFTIPSLYQVDRDAFFAALIVKKWINYVEKP